MTSTRRDHFVAAVRTYIGTPYRHLGRLPGVALDCAGVVWCGLRAVGIELPEPFYGMIPTISGLEGELQKIAAQRSVALVQPGDVIATIYHGSLGHASVYVGEGMVVQALARRGGDVRMTPMVNARSAWTIRGIG